MNRPPFSSYAHEKLYQAVLSLVTDYPLRQRLEHAAMYVTRLQADDFPDVDTARRWRELYEDLTWLESRDPRDGTIRATTSNLIEYDADKLAERIVSLFMRVKRP